MSKSLRFVSKLLALGATISLMVACAAPLQSRNDVYKDDTVNAAIRQIMAGMKNPQNTDIVQRFGSKPPCNIMSMPRPDYVVCTNAEEALRYILAEKKQYLEAKRYLDRLEQKFPFYKTGCHYGFVRVFNPPAERVFYSIPALQYVLANALSAENAKAKMYQANLCSIPDLIAPLGNHTGFLTFSEWRPSRQNFIDDARKFGGEREGDAARLYFDDIAVPLYQTRLRMHNQVTKNGYNAEVGKEYTAKYIVLLARSIDRAKKINLPPVYIDFLTQEKSKTEYSLQESLR